MSDTDEAGFTVAERIQSYVKELGLSHLNTYDLSDGPPLRHGKALRLHAYRWPAKAAGTLFDRTILIMEIEGGTIATFTSDGELSVVKSIEAMRTMARAVPGRMYASAEPDPMRNSI